LTRPSNSRLAANGILVTASRGSKATSPPLSTPLGRKTAAVSRVDLFGVPRYQMLEATFGLDLTGNPGKVAIGTFTRRGPCPRLVWPLPPPLWFQFPRIITSWEQPKQTNIVLRLLNLNSNMSSLLYIKAPWYNDECPLFPKNPDIASRCVTKKKHRQRRSLMAKNHAPSPIYHL